eukprot:m.1073452 g.1073452  ORF g.1073452 m.1073452 type:complete len:256 (+) comp24233_c0_seq5:222-989(+)
MPPKKEKKKTPEQLEEERLAEIAEAERLRKEQEAAQAERDRLKAIEDDLRERRPIERSAFKTAWDSLMKVRQASVQRAAAESEWEKYLACEDLPAPNDVPGINTFVGLWLETDYENDFDVIEAIHGFSEVNAVADALETYIQDKSMDGEYGQAASAADLLTSVHASILTQLDKFTAKLLQYADDRGSRVAQDLSISSVETIYKYFLWGNLSKDPDQGVCTYSSFSCWRGYPCTTVVTSLFCRMRLFYGAARHNGN